jgi:heterotetrameric sarcosine oxidase gamma subunit
VADIARGSLSARGVSVELERGLSILSLRRFDEYASAPVSLTAALEGLALPDALRATSHESRSIILAWKTPSEIVFASDDKGSADAVLHAVIAHRDWGCAVDLTGGIHIWRLQGERVRELLERIGSTDSMPMVGEARVSRIAELPVLAVAVREDEVRLFVESVYSDHLRGWIAETLQDLIT